MTKKFILISAGFILFLLASLTHVGALLASTTLDDYLAITPISLPFGHVFPEEILFKNILIALSQSFMSNDVYDDIEYHIQQKVVAKDPVDKEYCVVNPDDFTRCYPTLCPYLSKDPDFMPANDQGVPAFHDPAASTSIAYGRLAKSDFDTDDNWTIDLHAPCFRGECAQDNITPKDYELDSSLNGQKFACDLSIIIDRISFRNEKEGTIGFWKNWDRHKTYNQNQINQWLASINGASGWLMSENGYASNTSGMVALINDAVSCDGSTRSCAKIKFLAQYMAMRLNILSGRKSPGFTYTLTTLQLSYLNLTNPAHLDDIILKIEAKLPDSGTSPTRDQFLIMQSVADYINNLQSYN